MRQFNANTDQQNFISAAGKIFSAIDRKGRFRRTPPHLSVAIALAMLVLLAAVLWYSYPREAAYQEDAALPLIRAEAGPFREAPADPGGMEIPYRDSTVFETMRGGDKDKNQVRVHNMENLLSDEEEPVDRDRLFAGLKTEEGERAGAAISTRPKVIHIERPAEPSAAKKTVPITGNYYVQLGSLTAPEAAQKHWEAMKASFPDVLGALSLKVEKADLGARGVYYRVQAGPVSESRAREICSVITEKKPGGCLVVRP